ncbi:hypothetical protein, partial [Shewanella chilikensis]|uniref:hypothetical protein n=1 Tax=Shewanella chilikensis TaxID=558541 RepID=UPI003A9803BB
KPTNRFPIVSHQKDRSTDPYLIYIAAKPGIFYWANTQARLEVAGAGFYSKAFDSHQAVPCLNLFLPAPETP